LRSSSTRSSIFLTLAISTILYVLVLWVSLITVPTPELAVSGAPIALVFERLTGASPLTMSAIAIVATLNGIIVQMIMSSRVLYGLGRAGGFAERVCLGQSAHTDPADSNPFHDDCGVVLGCAPAAVSAC
jgi:APA family basic amino acid/polyamine antiporter